MNIKTYDSTIEKLLLSGSQFIIPRFQREYTWTASQYKEFFEDILACLRVDNSGVYIEPYFLGTMLFIGDCSSDSDKKVYVIDGQQRLTTVTILLSTLSEKFLSINNEFLSEDIFKYIMTKDDKGNSVRILQSTTHYPFFSYYIQQRIKDYIEKPNTEEEISIKRAFEYFDKQLDEKNVRGLLNKYFDSSAVNKLDYVDILKAIRDEVLKSMFVSISTDDEKQANKIFEILNAKGKKLSEIDLIKNKIFEVLTKEEPADFATEKWKSIKRILDETNTGITMETFYRHYWISSYCKSSANMLYSNFKKVIIPKTEDVYRSFLIDIENNALLYKKIVCPKREDYKNKKEYFWLVQSLNILNNYFGIVQVRIAVLALMRAKDNSIVSTAEFKNTIQYLEKFHFAYNAVMSMRSNRFDSVYANFAVKLNGCTNKSKGKKVINELLIEKMDALYPNYEEFKNKFILLQYSKENLNSNLRTKYIINKINCHYSGNDVFDDNGSIEHILPETDGEEALNIGNLILLEDKLNNMAGCKKYDEKKDLYSESNYKWVQQFIIENESWDESKIKKRAEKLSELVYYEVLK